MNSKLTPFDFLAKNRIACSDGENGWTLSAAGKTVFLSRDFSLLKLADGSHQWTVATAEAPLRVRHGGEEFDVPLGTSEMSCRWDEYGALGGYRFAFGNLRKDGLEFDIGVALFLALNWQTGETVVEIQIREDGEDRVVFCRWPGGFTGDCTERTVYPFRQGMLIPRNWPDEISGHGDCIDPATKLYVANSRVLYMPWWGVESKGGAAMMIVDTPDDFGFDFHHPAGGPTCLETRFLPSLDKFRYARRLIFKTFRQGNYVTLARAFRAYLEERGKFVSLKEKIARTPKLAKMIGGAVIHCGLLYEWTPGTIEYDAEHPEKNKRIKHASEIASAIQKLHDNGLRDAYLHLDGWGYKGYDALEPDSIPIGEEAGGEEGVLEINRLCHKLNFLFAFHQQYRDNYLDAASFDENKLFMQKDGTHRIDFLWCGGKNGLICSSFAPEFTRRNNRYFESIGLKLDGSYLDVFSVTPLDECHCPDHPVTRSECMANRAECFAYIKHTQGIVSSEEAIAWAMPYIDLVHHAPWVVDAESKARGIPVPLFNLVFHDSLIIPWANDEWSSGYIPADRNARLCAMIHGGIPYVKLDASAEEIAELEPIRELNRHCALMPMTNHRFISDDFLEEESTFQDGTTVTVNHKNGAWNIKYPES